MFMMDGPTAWELIEGGAIPGLGWTALWLAISRRAACSERRRDLTAYWIVACALAFWSTLFILSLPMLAVACFWAPLGPLILAIVSIRRLITLRDRGTFSW